MPSYRHTPYICPTRFFLYHLFLIQNSQFSENHTDHSCSSSVRSAPAHGKSCGKSAPASQPTPLKQKTGWCIYGSLLCKKQVVGIMLCSITFLHNGLGCKISLREEPPQHFFKNLVILLSSMLRVIQSYFYS